MRARRRSSIQSVLTVGCLSGNMMLGIQVRQFAFCLPCLCPAGLADCIPTALLTQTSKRDRECIKGLRNCKGTESVQRRSKTSPGEVSPSYRMHLSTHDFGFLLAEASGGLEAGMHAPGSVQGSAQGDAGMPPVLSGGSSGLSSPLRESGHLESLLEVNSRVEAAMDRARAQLQAGTSSFASCFSFCSCTS